MVITTIICKMIILSIFMLVNYVNYITTEMQVVNKIKIITASLI